MTEITPFAGYEVLDPGDPLSSDGYRFQLVNPQIADRLDQIGCVLHQHDGHAAMADPHVAPVLVTGIAGGSIPAATVIYVLYTLLDGSGGETLAVATVSITTPDGYQDPDAGPTAVPSYVAGSLLAANFDYAVTVTDGAGGETIIGPNTTVPIDPGHAHAEVALSGLTTITNDASLGDSAGGWRLWRRQDGGAWYLIGTGTHATDTFTDSGVVGDCTVAPPIVSTTTGTNVLQVTVPSAGQPVEATGFNLYASPDGTFTSPALLGTFPAADFDAVKTFTNLDAILVGSPPPVSTCIPGAQKIDAGTDIANLSWKAPAASLAALPALGNIEGDARVALDGPTIYVWHTGEWVGVSGGGGGGDDELIYYQATVALLPPLGVGDVAMLNSMDLGTATDADVRAFGATYAVGAFDFKAGMNMFIDQFLEVQTDPADGYYYAIWAVYDQADPVNPGLPPQDVSSSSSTTATWDATGGGASGFEPFTDGTVFAFLLCAEYNGAGAPGTYWTGAPTAPANDKMQKAIFRVH